MDVMDKLEDLNLHLQALSLTMNALREKEGDPMDPYLLIALKLEELADQLSATVGELYAERAHVQGGERV